MSDGTRQFTGREINQVLEAVRTLEPSDGDIQLSILAMALVVACKSCGVSREVALAEIAKCFDRPIMLVPIPDAEKV